MQPTVTFDRDWLHLEARYNYENLDTGSAWVGYNFSGGEKLAWEFTPMLGGVFGNTTGIAPGYKGSLSWWKLELYSEGEYVFDTGDSSESFFYTWSELIAGAGGLVSLRSRHSTNEDFTKPTLISSADSSPASRSNGWTSPRICSTRTTNRRLCWERA